MKKLITIALAGLILFGLTALPVFSDPGPDPASTLDTLGMPVPPGDMGTMSSNGNSGTGDSNDTIVDPEIPWDNPDK